MNKISKKQFFIGVAVMVIPFSSVAVGSYFLYKYLTKPKRKPPTTEEFIQSLRDEVKEDQDNE